MTDSELVHLLRNTPVLKLIKALEKDGFVLKRATRSGGISITILGKRK